MDSHQHDEGYNDATERTPLVGRGSEEGQQRPRRPQHRPGVSVTSIASLADVHVPKAHNPDTILALLAVIIIIASSAGGFSVIPATKLVENVICHQYYGQMQSIEKAIDVELCKVDAVQSKVAYVFAMSSASTAIVGFFSAFPWGIAADRIGRKPVFALSLIGMSLGILWDMIVLYFHNTFPVELVPLDALFMVVGGGNAVVVSILMSMVSDIVPEEKRAVAFMRLHVASLCGNLVSPSFSSAMMSAVGPWPVMWLAIACLLLASIAFAFVPETLQHKGAEDDAASRHQPNTIREHIDHIYDRLKESLAVLKSPSLILLLLTCLGSTPVSSAILQFMVQFVSKRYGVALEYMGYIQSSYGLAQAIHAIIILPWLSRLILRGWIAKRLGLSNEAERDLFLAKCSFAIIIAGFVILGAAPVLGLFVFGLIIMALGSGSSALTRSTMTLYVDPEHRSRLFSAVGMIEVAGSVYGHPMLAGLFTLGMRLGGGWIGLPYYGVAVLVTLSLGALLFVRLPNRAVSSEEASTSEV
ncbi:major facilitator superfamily transporter [Xylariales sp. PMI_506]|nr:major facilitator superfamily transporter [Xylariales sp. PMI_506]